MVQFLKHDWPAKILAITHFWSQEYEAMSPDSLRAIKRMGGWARHYTLKSPMAVIEAY